MAQPIAINGIHHLRLTVTDVKRSREFYMGLLGFGVAAETPPAEDPSYDAVNAILFGGVVLIKGNLLLGLRPVAPQGDHFDENRVGLDHLSFSVGSRGELEEAARLLDEHNVPHGAILDLPSFGIYVMELRDPDNIQLELTAPHS
jgi:catechol 2,3-dioxygenase-like lactoylglutathione lyase family enzyme